MRLHSSYGNTSPGNLRKTQTGNLPYRRLSECFPVSLHAAIKIYPRPIPFPNTTTRAYLIYVRNAKSGDQYLWEESKMHLKNSRGKPIWERKPYSHYSTSPPLFSWFFLPTSAAFHWRGVEEGRVKDTTVGK